MTSGHYMPFHPTARFAKEESKGPRVGSNMTQRCLIQRARIYRGFFVGMRGPRIPAADLASAKTLAAALSREGGIFGVAAPVGDGSRLGFVAWYRKGERS